MKPDGIDFGRPTHGASSMTNRFLLGYASGFLTEEAKWRQPTNPAVLASTPGGLAVNRYTDLGTDARERSADVSGDYYTLSIGLRPTELVAYADGRKVFEGKTQAGAIHLEQPGTSARGIFRAPTAALHVFVASQLLIDFHEEIEAGVSFQFPYLRSVYFALDPSLVNLLGALAQEQQGGDSVDHVYAEALCVSIVAHLLRRYADKPVNAIGTSETGLVPWRVRRVIDYIEANLAQPISLSDLARIAGLSRMHFALQFRRATGFRPHECLLMRRIARARELLLHSDLALLPVALAVGFENQAHFSRVFKRLTGETPSAWRAAHKR